MKASRLTAVLSALALGVALTSMTPPAGAAPAQRAHQLPSGHAARPATQTHASRGHTPNVSPVAVAGRLHNRDQGHSARAEVRPGAGAQHSLRGVVPGPDAVIVPDSHFGCNSSVCIYIYGWRLHVDDWVSSAYSDGYHCTYATYWVNGNLFGTSNPICGYGSFWSVWPIDRYFGDGAELCTTWAGIDGRPCATVHN